MDIDKLILEKIMRHRFQGFSSLMDIDKLIQKSLLGAKAKSFSSLMDIDKLILPARKETCSKVLVH